MAAVVENTWGWLLNQQVAIEKYSKTVSDGDKMRSYSCKEDLFNITQPHITVDHRGRDGDGLEAVAMGTNSDHGQEEEAEPMHRKSRKRKRKRTTDLNSGETAAMEYHYQIRTKLIQAHTAFLSLGRANGLFQNIPDDVPVGRPVLDWGPGNCLAELCDLARLTEDEKPLVLSQGGVKYHLIVMDPPWENKSVKRGKKYESLSAWQLFQLPISSLAAPGCLVVTWVTNRQQHMKFVRERLYPHWSVEPVAEWHWLKVTQTGEPVFPMDSPHKKPYETIILGRFKDQSEARSPPLCDVPKHKVICSVPCVIHSRKPQLDEVLQKYLPPSPICLELFARSLQPSWTSWGNEVIKFQHLDFFNEDQVEKS